MRSSSEGVQNGMRTKSEPGREGICKGQTKEWVPIDEANKKLLER